MVTELSRIIKVQNETSSTEELFKAVKYIAEQHYTSSHSTQTKRSAPWKYQIHTIKKKIYKHIKEASDTVLERLSQGTKQFNLQ